MKKINDIMISDSLKDINFDQSSGLILALSLATISQNDSTGLIIRLPDNEGKKVYYIANIIDDYILKVKDRLYLSLATFTEGDTNPFEDIPTGKIVMLHNDNKESIDEPKANN